METTTARPATIKSPDTKEDLIDRLNDLISLDFDAIAAYDAAIDRLEQLGYRQQLMTFKNDHIRHTRELAECVTNLGGKPETEGGAKQLLTKGKVVLAGLIGDKTIMKAMRSNEEETTSKYKDALEACSPRGDVRVRSILERGLADERQHLAWFTRTVEVLDNAD